MAIQFSVTDLQTPDMLERVLQQFQTAISGLQNAPAPTPTPAPTTQQLQNQLQPFVQNLITTSIAPLIFTYVSLSASTAINTSHAYPNILMCTGIGNSQTLPVAGQVPGQAFFFMQDDTHSTTIVGTINGSSNYSLASHYKFVFVVSLNSLWYILDSN